MEKYIALAIAILALTGTTLFLKKDHSPSTIQTSNPTPTTYQNYIQWKSKYNKNYNGPEDKLRYEIFNFNSKYIEQWNSEGSPMVIGTNVFADLTLDEFEARYLTLTRPLQERIPSNMPIVPPTSDDSTVIDWVKGGAVSPIENQGNCGSCWAFSTAGALTGLNFVQSGQLEVFSKQQLVSCDHVDAGCNGGHFVNGFTYTKANGISLESQYPYEQAQNPRTKPCDESKIKSVFKNSGYGQVEKEDVQGMLNALQKLPLSIAVGASSLAFQLYQKGTIIHKGCPANLNHAILLVGVDLSASNPDDKYWTVKNSWGAGWGDGGYAKILYQEGGKGVCGINEDVAYPT